MAESDGEKKIAMFGGGPSALVAALQRPRDHPLPEFGGAFRTMSGVIRYGMAR